MKRNERTCGGHARIEGIDIKPAESHSQRSLVPARTLQWRASCAAGDGRRGDIREIHRVIPNTITDALDNSIDPDVVDIFSRNDYEADVEIILHAALPL